MMIKLMMMFIMSRTTIQDKLNLKTLNWEKWKTFKMINLIFENLLSNFSFECCWCYDLKLVYKSGFGLAMTKWLKLD